jgi:hypothetical protein
MPSILNQRDARAVMQLPFCYVCGISFIHGACKNRDHIPPESAFRSEDRSNFPLLLPTHIECNHIFNLEDELLGQLIALSHSPQPQEKISGLKIEGWLDQDGNPYAFLRNVDLHQIIKRWISAFHAALYQEPLPPTTRFSIQTPLPPAIFVSNSIQTEPDLEQFLIFERKLGVNHDLGLTDRIVANNNQLQYTCSWQRADHGQWLTFFKVDLYAWSNLGDAKNFFVRNCVGAYGIPGDIPALATRGTAVYVGNT